LVAVIRGSAVVALLLTSLVAAGPARGQSQRAYRDGVKAAEKGDWSSVQQLMTAAIADRAEEKKRYTPHYYLGLALFELGDCSGALQSWSTSEQQGALGKDELAKVRDGRGVCQARENEQAVAAAQRGAQAALDQAARSSTSLRSAIDSDIEDQWRAGSPSPRNRQAAAEARLESARTLVEQARASGDTAGLARGESEARQAKQQLDALHEEAKRLVAEHGERVGALRSKAAALVTSARELLRSTAELAPYAPQIERKHADLESLVAEVETKSDRGDDYLDGVISRTTFAMQQLKEAAAPPPRALSQAADSFFGGDYSGVVDQLAAFADESPRTRAHSLLLRSAARYYLWVEQGEGDADLLAAAAADAAESQRVDSGLQPPASLFSPRFLEFWNGARAPAETP
jgi:hypothetical protein